MIYFTTVPLRFDGCLEHGYFYVPESQSTEDVLNTHAKLWRRRFGTVDPELDLYNFVANRWPFINLESRALTQTQQVPLAFSLS